MTRPNQCPNVHLMPGFARNVFHCFSSLTDNFKSIALDFLHGRPGSPERHYCPHPSLCSCWLCGLSIRLWLELVSKVSVPNFVPPQNGTYAKALPHQGKSLVLDLPSPEWLFSVTPIHWFPASEPLTVSSVHTPSPSSNQVKSIFISRGPRPFVVSFCGGTWVSPCSLGLPFLGLPPSPTFASSLSVSSFCSSIAPLLQAPPSVLVSPPLHLILKLLPTSIYFLTPKAPFSIASGWPLLHCGLPGPSQPSIWTQLFFLRSLWFPLGQTLSDKGFNHLGEQFNWFSPEWNVMEGYILMCIKTYSYVSTNITMVEAIKSYQTKSRSPLIQIISFRMKLFKRINQQLLLWNS